jgi:hypothetical protein
MICPLGPIYKVDSLFQGSLDDPELFLDAGNPNEVRRGRRREGGRERRGGGRCGWEGDGRGRCGWEVRERGGREVGE